MKAAVLCVLLIVVTVVRAPPPKKQPKFNIDEVAVFKRAVEVVRIVHDPDHYWRDHAATTARSIIMSRDMLQQILEEKFREIYNLLYNTNVPLPVLEKRIAPYLHEDVGFKDPWQEGRGKTFYLQGMRGFHCMTHFTTDMFQSAVVLNEDATKGRALFDGTMNIHPLGHIPLLKRWTYPLRVFIIFHFDVINSDSSERENVKFLIRDHEETWSFGDMLEALPLVGIIYRRLFRRMFAQGFLLASRLSTSFHQSIQSEVATGNNWQGTELQKQPQMHKPQHRALHNLW